MEVINRWLNILLSYSKRTSLDTRYPEDRLTLAQGRLFVVEQETRCDLWPVTSGLYCYCFLRTRAKNIPPNLPVRLLALSIKSPHFPPKFYSSSFDIFTTVFFFIFCFFRHRKYPHTTSFESFNRYGVILFSSDRFLFLFREKI